MSALFPLYLCGRFAAEWLIFMDINLYNEFLVLANTQSYLAAAEELYTSQATLSRHIKQLEESLGAQLFDRTSRKIRLTEYGLLLVPYAQQIVNSYQQTLDTFMRQLENKRQVINIGIANGADALIDIAGLISAYSMLYPNAQFNITNDYSTVLMESFKKLGYDFIFVREKERLLNEFTHIPYGSDYLAAYMSEEHPLAQRESIHIAELKSHPLIATAQEKLSTQLLLQECEKNGYSPWIIFRGTHAQISHYLRSGTGIAVLFKGLYSKTHTDHDLVSIDILPQISATINLICDEKSLSENKRTFLDFILHRKP